eukprot:CAMPEP_0119262898 /NCGR_PEP_ID=MMETSP1329-20130426/2461_1 /TAXON_ID=114041 /ORGANISM="Genus nov. species nov., Strain RCC1024" /LENGTH=535 /DNA_ID=CAMNT_0007262579 /DNA_START=279 /DNA_END=1882 /DNA_ORIENTATION=+
MDGGWNFIARQRLSASVSSLPPSCLNDVVHIIFGSTREIVIGDEFTVDFAKIGEGVCALLQEYVDSRRANAGSVQWSLLVPSLSKPSTTPSPPEPLASEVSPTAALANRVSGKQPRGTGFAASHAAVPRLPFLKKARARSVAPATAAAHICGVLPGRIAIDGSGCSVVAAVGRFHLILDDAALSLWWMDANTRACTWAPAPEPTIPLRGEDRVTADQCNALLAWLRRLDVSEAFAQPVRGVPAYDDIVREPVDLGTMAQKLRTGGYATTGAAGFAADARLIHTNAAAFCATSSLGADAIIYRMAQVLRAAFEHKWGQILAKAAKCGEANTMHARQTFMAQPSLSGRAETGWTFMAPRLTHAPGPLPAEPGRLVYHRVEVFWPRDKMWYAALVTDYRERDRRHCVEYDDGHVEWLELANPHIKYRVLGSSSATVDAPGLASALISVQKLGILVWAKSGAHPWWPAELCLPTATRFLDALPPPRGPGGPRAQHKKMVIYFGDTQYDILDTVSVVPFMSRPKPSGKGASGILKAYTAA